MGAIHRSRAITWLIVAIFSHLRANGHDYPIDDSVGLGPVFDGIGAISGGGATSRLLVNYPQSQREQILDYLFKVMTLWKQYINDGTEPSHMHSEDDENYQRGYEWYLMVQAKKRNPNIKLYGLPWAFPGWVGKGTQDPYKYPLITAKYITKWLMGAKKYYNLTIDYVGIWNERPFNSNYIKELRKTLNENGLEKTKIVAADNHWNDIASAIQNDPELAAVVDIIGAHYPGTMSPKEASATGKPLWASEDYSTTDNKIGGGCFARIINQNYVNGNMSSTIAWNLVASYYNGLPYPNDGLMTANEPWSGHYEVASPIWLAAHTTQFAFPGWFYLKRGFGSGHLEKNGSFVTFIDPTKKKFAIVIEAMSHEHSQCIRPPLPQYTITNQVALFRLQGSLKNLVDKVTLWRTCLKFNGPSSLFERIGTIPVVNNVIELKIDVDCTYTITNTAGQRKGHYPNPPAGQEFPLPYHDDFDNYQIASEAKYFADQTGVFEIHNSNTPKHGRVMRQMVFNSPISWCTDAAQPISLIGNSDWKDITVQTDFLIEKGEGVLIAARIGFGGCNIAFTPGVVLRITIHGYFTLSEDLGGFLTIHSGKLLTPIGLNTWHTATLTVKGGMAAATFDHKPLFNNVFVGYSEGFAAIGAQSFIPVQFDNFSVRRS
ncbi:Galactocerebrosidase [Trichoplax sp. H2]|nr:Galactocerebrosidase [Trichoplax sp. H2]|eukprot:RDD42717.1 Galactocerebrosidase [Trichoplax sp. H2]